MLPRRAPYSLDPLRSAQADCVNRRRAAGNRQLDLLHGARLWSNAMLIDGSHLSIDGAAADTGRLATLLATLQRQHRPVP
jgi:hypothetical protein